MSEPMKIMLSVDFDFFTWRACEGKSKDMKLTFFPGTPEEAKHSAVNLFDWGHSERQAPIVQAILWATRWAGFRRVGLDPVKLTGVREEVGCVRPEVFVKTIEARFPSARSAPLQYADSHAWGFASAHDARVRAKPGEKIQLVHFDAHGDLGYAGEDLAGQRRAGSVSCASWAYHALRLGIVDEIVLVYPDWRGDEFSDVKREPHLKRFLKKIRATSWSEWSREGASGEVLVTNLARSGTWTPPWLDGLFLALKGSLPAASRSCLDCLNRNQHQDACRPRVFDREQAEAQFLFERDAIDEIKARVNK